MNLSITPVRFNNNSSYNYNNKNNKTQNFEALTDLVKVHKHPKESGDILRSITRTRDTLVDRFVMKMQDLAATTGYNTKALEENQFSLEFIPKQPYSRKMVAILTNGQDQIVRTSEGFPFSTTLKRGNELEQAEEFVEMMKDAKLIDKQA